MKDLLKHERLIQKTAWQAARKCGLTHQIEDVVQEAWVAALKALRTYNRDKGALTTHLCNSIYFSCISMYAKQENFPTLPENLDIPVAGDYEFPLWFQFLEEKEKEMVEYTFQTKTGKTGIIKHFAQKWGWNTAQTIAHSIKQKLAYA